MSGGDRAVQDLARRTQSLQIIEDAANRIRETNEHWNNLLSLPHSAWVNAYKEGWLEILINLEIVKSFNRNVGVSRSEVEPSANDGKFSFSVRQVTNDGEYPCTGYGDQEKVFLQTIKLVQAPKDCIPSLVRLCPIHDVITDCFGGLLYVSAIDGIHKVIPRPAKRESNPLGVCSRFPLKYFADGDIERTAEIVDDVSHHKGDIIWQGLSYLDFQTILSGFRVFFGSELKVVALGKFRDYSVKLIDVLLGPFNF